MDISDYIILLILFFLILLSAFFSSSETALTTINRVRIQSLADHGSKKATRLLRLLDRRRKMLSTILIGNNIVNISASALTTSLAIKLGGDTAVSISTGLLTLVILIYGEIFPKTYSLIHGEKISLLFAPLILGLMWIMTPIIFIIDVLSNSLLRLFHIDPDKKVTVMTEIELRSYLDVGHADGVIESDEKEMIYNVFDFKDAVARDIMIPRIDLTTAPVTATYAELLKIFRNSMYTRIPIFENETPNMIGIVNIKDFLLIPNKKEFSVRDILRSSHYTYELKKIADLLPEMRESYSNVSFVLNEYGETVGMITMEDLLEEIVGEIRDEYDTDEEDLICKEQEGVYLVAGNLKLDDINNALDIQLDSENYDSIGGMVIELLERLPRNHESVYTTDGYQLTVVGMKQNKIEKVRIAFPEDTPESNTDDYE